MVQQTNDRHLFQEKAAQMPDAGLAIRSSYLIAISERFARGVIRWNSSSGDLKRGTRS
jgi:hypothetical protein